MKKLLAFAVMCSFFVVGCGEPAKTDKPVRAAPPKPVDGGKTVKPDEGKTDDAKKDDVKKDDAKKDDVKKDAVKKDDAKKDDVKKDDKKNDK